MSDYEGPGIKNAISNQRLLEGIFRPDVQHVVVGVSEQAGVGFKIRASGEAAGASSMAGASRYCCREANFEIPGATLADDTACARWQRAWSRRPPRLLGAQRPLVGKDTLTY